MCKETDTLEVLENVNKIETLECKQLHTGNQYLEETCGMPGASDVSFASELVGGCQYMAGMALDPGSHAKKIAKDASDFMKFPDKSKLPQKIFTWEEVGKFDGEQGRPMYLVIDNKVYDFTDFADLHPAGPEPLKQHAGNDASAAMRAAGMPSAVMDDFIHYFKVGAVDKPRKAKFEIPTLI